MAGDVDICEAQCSTVLLIQQDVPERHGTADQNQDVRAYDDYVPELGCGICWELLCRFAGSPPTHIDLILVHLSWFESAVSIIAVIGAGQQRFRGCAVPAE